MTTPKKTKEKGKSQRPIKHSKNKEKKSVGTTKIEVKSAVVKAKEKTKTSATAKSHRIEVTDKKNIEQPGLRVKKSDTIPTLALSTTSASTSKLSQKKSDKKTANKTAGVTAVVDYESRLRLIRARHEAMQDDTEAFADEIEVADVAEVEPEPEPENEAGPEEE